MANDEDADIIVRQEMERGRKKRELGVDLNTNP